MRRSIANIALVTLLSGRGFERILIRSQWQSDTVYRQATPQAWSIAPNDGGMTPGRRNYDGLWLRDANWR